MGFSAFANLNGTKPKKHKTLYLFTDERKPFCAIHYRVTIVLSDTPESKIQGQDDVRLLKFLARFSPECSATGMELFPICKLKWDLLRTSVKACTIDNNTFSAPFGIFYVRTEI